MLGSNTEESLEVNDESAKRIRDSPYLEVDVVRVVRVFLHEKCSHCCRCSLQFGLVGTSTYEVLVQSSKLYRYSAYHRSTPDT